MKALLIAVAWLAGGAAAASADEIHVKTDAYEFTYSYPAAAARIPALKARLDKAAARQQAEIAAQAREGRAAAKQNSFPFNPYNSSTGWQVVADLPAWLSLSGTSGDYTGGAHPNHGPTALLWDKTRNREVKAADLFASKAALSAAIRAPFCAALNRERAEKRGKPIDPKSKDEFDACLDPVDEVVILGSADHAHFTRIGVLMGPYAAGPYVEGDYDVTLPVTQAVLSAVRPEYRDAFALGAASAKR
jgi:hypothetical protein